MSNRNHNHSHQQGGRSGGSRTSSSSSKSNYSSIFSSLLEVVSNEESVWLLGHMLFLIQGCLYLLFANHWYYKSLFCLFISYSVAIYRFITIQLRTSSSTPTFRFIIGSLLTESKVLYGFLVIILWLMSPPFSLLYLVHYIYSLYSVLSLPSMTTSVSPIIRNHLISPILTYQSNVYLICSHIEILALFFLITRLIGSLFLAQYTFFSSLIPLLLYPLWLRCQYAASPRLRLACSKWTFTLDNYTAASYCPPAIRDSWKALKRTLKKLDPSIKVSSPPSSTSSLKTESTTANLRNLKSESSKSSSSMPFDTTKYSSEKDE